MARKCPNPTCPARLPRHCRYCTQCGADLQSPGLLLNEAIRRDRSLIAELKALLARASRDLTAWVKRVLDSTGARWIVRTCMVVELASAMTTGPLIVAAAVTVLLVYEWFADGQVQVTEERVSVPLLGLAPA